MSNIIEHLHDGQRWVFVEVEQSATNVRVVNSPDISLSMLEYYTSEDFDNYIELPAENWQIHSDTSTITEEQAREIVPLIDDDDPLQGYEHFMTDEEFKNRDFIDALSTAKQSLHSLIRSKGGDANKRYVVLKEVK